MIHHTIRPMLTSRPFPLSSLVFSDRLANVLRLVARVWWAVFTIAFLALALRGGIPQSPDQDTWEIYAQLLLLLLVGIGGFLARQSESLGATLITVGAVGLGALAALEYSPLQALGIAVIFYIPGLIFWFVWQRTKPLWEVGILALVLAVTLTVGGVSANRLYATYFGPVQPESPLVAQPVSLVKWVWAGATTDTSFVVKAEIATPTPSPHLLVSTSQDLATPRIVEGVVQDTIAAFVVGGLEANTDYWYAIADDSITDTSRQGHIRTFPAGPASFTLAFGSCAETGSNGAVFDTIRGHNPLFFLETGDLYYEDITINDQVLFQDAFDRTLASPAQAALFQSTSAVYMWDDHDFGPNDADRNSSSREAARLNYRNVVPHYELPTGNGDAAVYQAFTVGRVRFIVTDNRSERVPEAAIDDSSKSMLGAEQKAWFKQQLLDANGHYAVIVWVNTVPWIADQGAVGEGWGTYSTERQELSNFIVDNHIQGLVMLAGDAHQLAIDDGTNSNYSNTQGAGFPVFHAAALDRHGSRKGGPYSEGQFPGGGQFGLMTVNDDGGATIEIVWSGRNYQDKEIIGYRFTVETAPVTSGEIARQTEHGAILFLTIPILIPLATRRLNGTLA